MASTAHGSIAVILASLVAVVLSAPPPPSPSSSPSSAASFDLLMPDVQPKEADTYLCNAVKVEEAHRYMTAFDPKADSHVAHHILLYGCGEPGMEPGHVWNCGEMSASGTPTIPRRGVCKSGQTILYAWAMDAPKLHLPPDVGFDVGQETPVKYLVLQVHYKDVSHFLPPENKRDTSGLTITTSPTRTPKEAGVYLLATGGFIPAKSTEYFESACEYKDKEMVPFAYRTHAHSLGRVISGYRIRDREWTELGRKDPRDPEMFYNVTKPGTTIKKGDILAARCTMENTKDHTVTIGTTQNDEMCNFYIMYYVENPPTPSTKHCATRGPPRWYWYTFEDQEKINLSGMPATVSVIPGTDRLLQKTTHASGQQGSYSSPFMDPVSNEGLGGQTMDVAVDSVGAFQEQTVEQMLDEAVNEMNPDELYYLIKELAREEEQEEARQQMWLQRQRMREQNMMYL